MIRKGDGRHGSGYTRYMRAELNIMQGEALRTAGRDVLVNAAGGALGGMALG